MGAVSCCCTGRGEPVGFVPRSRRRCQRPLGGIRFDPVEIEKREDGERRRIRQRFEAGDCKKARRVLMRAVPKDAM